MRKKADRSYELTENSNYYSFCVGITWLLRSCKGNHICSRCLFKSMRTGANVASQGKKRLSRSKSGIWYSAKIKYIVKNWEWREILKALKKIKYWLYQMQFVLKTDAKQLVTQLN